MTVFATPLNNVIVQVTQAYSPGSGSLVVSDGSKFPALSGSNFYRVSLFRASTPLSILKITAVSGNTLTVGSALEGTADVALQVGDFVKIDVTAGTIGDLQSAVASSGGTVSSVALSVPADLTATGSPVTSTGTFVVTRNSQSANTFLAAPSGAPGVPSFRQLVSADVPSIPESLVVNLVSDLGAKALDSSVVHNSGNETVGGTKTFSSLPTLPTQSSNVVFCGPSSGVAASPTFRSLVTADIPNLPGSIISSGTVAAARLGLMTGANGSIGGASGAVPAPAAADNVKFFRGDGTWASTPGGAGTVTSVALAMPIGEFSVSGSPVTASGTLSSTWANQSGFKVLAAGSSPAAPSFINLTYQHLPVMVGDSGSGGAAGIVPAPATGDATHFLRGDGAWVSAPVTTVAGKTGAVTLAESDITSLTTDLGLKAPLASPSFTGTPLAPTPSTADNSTKISTTAYVQAQNYLTSAPVTSVAGKTGVVTLVEGDISNLTTDLAARMMSLSPTSVQTGNYNANANELVPVDTTSGGLTVKLPNAPVDKTLVVVKHVTQGGSNTVTVSCQGSDVFNKASGTTSATISLLSQAILVQYKATGAIWYVIADDLPLSQLDSRYIQSVTLTTNGVLYSTPVNFSISSGAASGSLSLISQTANTFLAAPNGSSGAPSFRTVVQADLPVMTGDSGSGGAKGAVPAPASGDASAGKYLGAGGTWSLTPGVNRQYKSGLYLPTVPTTSVSVGNLGSNILRLHPCWFSQALTIIRIVAEVTSIGDASRTVADAVTNGTTTVTSATAAFVATDAGKKITGTNIPSGAYIVSITNGTTIVISAAASGSGSGGSITLGVAARLGIYSDAGTGYPGNLLLDAGVIDGTSATVQEITISQAIGPGLYWFGTATQGVTTTAPQFRTLNAASYDVPMGTTALPTAAQVIPGYSQSSITGALSNFTSIVTPASLAPRMFFKVN